MFALDLFNNDHERRLAEGAVDKLEQRRIDDLAMKMDELVARAKQVKDPEHKAALVREFQKVKAERDSYFKIKDECMGYGSLVGEESHMYKGPHGRQDVEHKGGVTRVQRRDSDWDTDDRDNKKLGIKHFSNNKLKGLGTGTAVKSGSGVSSSQGSMRKMPRLDHDANDQPNYEVDEAGIPGNVPADKIPGKEDLLKGKGRKYYEADQKKNPEDPKLARLKVKARRAHPQAETDDEALSLHILDKEQTDVDQLSRENEREDRMIAQLRDLEQNLQKQIDKLTSDDVEEGWSNKMVAQRTGQAPTPYSVYIKGKEWKSFADDDHAENVANKLRAKFKQEGKDPSVITIAPTGLKEDIGGWIVYDPETKQIKKRFKTHTAGKSYAKAHNLGFASSEYYFDNVKQPVNEFAPSLERDDNDEVPNQILKLANRWWNAAGDQPKIENVLRSLGWSIHQVESEDDAVQLMHNDGTTYFISADDFDPEVFEGIVASGPSHPLDDRAVRKLVWDTMKINADTGEQAIQRALSVLAKKPQSRMVQDLQDKFQTLADRLGQQVAEDGERIDPILIRALNNMPDGLATHREVLDAAYDAYAMELGKMKMKSDYGVTNVYVPKLLGLYKDKHGLTFNESETDYSKRRQREKDIDAGKPVPKQRQPRMTDYQKRRAQQKKELELGEDSSTSSEDAERAILNRIMVAHLDLLKQYGPQKVMQAVEEVAYNVGDLDEIGSSDVSGWVRQVEQILGQ